LVGRSVDPSLKNAIKSHQKPSNAIKNKICNHLLNQVKKLGYERKIYRNNLTKIYTRVVIHSPVTGKSVSTKFTELCIHGDAMMMPVQMGTNKNIYQ